MLISKTHSDLDTLFRNLLLFDRFVNERRSRHNTSGASVKQSVSVYQPKPPTVKTEHSGAVLRARMPTWEKLHIPRQMFAVITAIKKDILVKIV